jgi:hypothetical protein
MWWWVAVRVVVIPQQTNAASKYGHGMEACRRSVRYVPERDDALNLLVLCTNGNEE